MCLHWVSVTGPGLTDGEDATGVKSNDNNRNNMRRDIRSSGNDNNIKGISSEPKTYMQPPTLFQLGLWPK